MLVLSRREGESIVIDGNIKITINRLGNERVRLAIDAPKEMKIVREETLKKEDEQ